MDISAILGGGGMESILKMFGGADGMQGLIKKFATPENIDMIGDKAGDIFEFVAKQKGCSKNEIGFYTKWENISIKDAAGNIQMGEDGKPLKKEQAVIYIMIGNQAKETYTLGQFIQLMLMTMNEQKDQPEQVAQAAEVVK